MYCSPGLAWFPSLNYVIEKYNLLCKNNVSGLLIIHVMDKDVSINLTCQFVSLSSIKFLCYSHKDTKFLFLV